MKVVSNTSPLIGLAKIGRLALLQQLFQRIMIPRTVYDEFFQAATPSEERHFQKVATGFVQIVKVEQLCSFSRRLDRGESEVLTLALQEEADFVILDDRKAFNEARGLQLAAVSTRTVLTFAEERHLIPSYREIEDELRINQFYPPKY
uniref:hypothetical protein n=1 Tax=Candidatus Electrothrix sp. TaxID=2170559 RepID=UPI0040561ED1